MNLRLRQIILIVADIISINLSFMLAIIIRFEGNVFTDANALQYIYIYLDTFIYISFLKIIIFQMFKMYSSLWRYASVEELVQVVFASLTATMATITINYGLSITIPRSIYALTFILDTVFIGGVRFMYRYFRRSRRSIFTLNKNESTKNILLIGAGVAGSILIKEFKQNPNADSMPIAILDDDTNKIGLSIHGIKVVGPIQVLKEKIEELNIDEVLIAIPSADRKLIRKIIELTKGTQVKIRTLPSIYNLADGKVSISEIRDVDIDDLLGRDQVKLDMEEINQFIKGKCVMVTGGGGSIGSELCRQICKYHPKHLSILDIYENNVYDLQIELTKAYPDISFDIIIASVRDIERLDEIFTSRRPHIVFHAAAHKHVPLMEFNPKEAIKNNIYGTKNLIETAKKHKVKKFVMISTDKAVNPTNVMGATKRATEMMIQNEKDKSQTDFVAVRFGNVLGSNGSVIPLFKKQIKEGGPITLTDENIIRYFMTIPEAAQLVMQAGAMAKGGEVFILDMGEPVKIIDLAKNLIRLSGLKPYEDIDIKVTGLRPGEKLFEELLLDKDQDIGTKHKKIFIEKPTMIDEARIKQFFINTQGNINVMTSSQVRDELKKLVETYTDS